MASCATSVDDIVLNSDLIRQEFGSYGVDVLYSSDQRRVSSLYSGEPGQEITRTLAVVDFNAAMSSTMASEHRRILSGGSIGETFRSAGWHIEKQHIFIGELTVTDSHPDIADLMQIGLPRQLASHVYVFAVSKDEKTLSYATIYEFHHPDFITSDELEAFYGAMLFDDSKRETIDDFITLPANLPVPN